MRRQGPRALWARHGDALVSALIGIYGLVYTMRQVRGARSRAPGDLENLDLDFRISDFEAFYRCALRMLEGRPMYFTDGTGPLEQPGKQAPFFELLLQPFAPFGFGVTVVVFGVVTTLALLSSMRLGRQLVHTSPEQPGAARWTPYLALVLLLAPLHLNFLYFQTGVLLVWLFLLGMHLLPRRPLLAGIVWSLAISSKVIPVVLLPWMLWRRQWRCVLGMLLGLVVANAAVLAYTGFDKGVQQYQGYVHMLRGDPVFDEYNERYQSIPSLVRATVTPHYQSRIGSTAQARSWDGVRNFLGGTSLAAYADLLVLGAIGLVLAACAWACRPGRPSPPWRLLLEGSLVTLAMLLVSPHTWRHYYWWLWPTVLCAVHAARNRQPWAIAIVAVVAATEFLPHRGLIGELAIWYQVFHGHTIGALAVFTLLATHLIRSTPETSQATQGKENENPEA